MFSQLKRTPKACSVKLWVHCVGVGLAGTLLFYQHIPLTMMPLTVMFATDLVSCERKGSARLFFQSSSSLKCCSFTAGGVLEGRKAAGLQLPVSLLKTVEQPLV